MKLKCRVIAATAALTMLVTAFPTGVLASQPEMAVTETSEETVGRCNPVLHVEDNGSQTAYMLTLEGCSQDVTAVRFTVSQDQEELVGYYAKKDVSGNWVAIFDMNDVRRGGTFQIGASLGFLDGAGQDVWGTSIEVAGYTAPEQSKTNKVSILGDSISTYNDGSGRAYYSYYSPEHMDRNRTWWMQYINAFGMQLGYNEALGGSRVTSCAGDGMSPGSAMSCDERIRQLGSNGTPDEILFFGGINDIFQKGSVPAGQYSYQLTYGKVDDFVDAYYTTVMKLKFYYPNADIVCIIPYNTWAVDTSLVDSFADGIINICKEFNLAYVDLRFAGVIGAHNMAAPDYLHPNENGMDKIATNVIISMFLNKIQRTSGYWKRDTGGVRHFCHADGSLMTNAYICDGVYKYYVREDGTPMRDVMTYDSDGTNLMYLDEWGHQLYNSFRYCDNVGYVCFFDENGHASFDRVVTYNGHSYYMDGTGRLKQNGWFWFDNGQDLGFANWDGTLVTDTFSYDLWGRVVYFQSDGKVAKGLIYVAPYYYYMDPTDGHCVGCFQL